MRVYYHFTIPDKQADMLGKIASTRPPLCHLLDMAIELMSEYDFFKWPEFEAAWQAPDSFAP